MRPRSNLVQIEDFHKRPLFSAMGSHACYAAMRQHHDTQQPNLLHVGKDGAGLNAIGPPPNTDWTSSELPQPPEFLAGQELASRFSQAAAAQLSPTRLGYLTQFFLAHAATANECKANLCHQMRLKLEAFYQEEMSLSGGARDRLAAPSGDPGAGLGLILHIQHCDESAAAFWDAEDSATIKLLKEKGIPDKKVFGYDWHWRAEKASDRSNPRCPARAWSKSVQELHDGLSEYLLDLLPLPYLIIGGSCAKGRFEKTINERFCLVEVNFLPPDGKLKF